MYKTIHIDIALPQVRASNILQLFKIIAKEASKVANLPEQKILEHLIEKETEQTSALGNGVAIPHVQNSIIKERICVLASLERPIHMDTPDAQAVDLVGVLLSPESDGPIHLRGLSRFSRLMKNQELCQILRECKDADAMKTLLINPDGWLMAA